MTTIHDMTDGELEAAVARLNAENERKAKAGDESAVWFDCFPVLDEDAEDGEKEYREELEDMAQQMGMK